MEDLEGAGGKDEGALDAVTLAKEGLAEGRSGERGGRRGAQGATLGAGKTRGGGMGAEAMDGACTMEARGRLVAIPPKAGGSSSS